MNREDDSFPSAYHRENVMAAVDSGENPTALLKNPRKIATRDLLHTATSMI